MKTAYVVALATSDALYANAILAPTPEMAIAAAMVGIFKETDRCEEPRAVIVVPLALEFLRVALVEMSGSTGGVVKLVQPEPDPAA